jgi:hypothetical protein
VDRCRWAKYPPVMANAKNKTTGKSEISKYCLVNSLTIEVEDLVLFCMGPALQLN